ncbi:MAG: hypothetical protein KFF77_08535, partial [Bacteroidetes bacterium]|nr:hypothetical protein [Bacteroidota bacterium]
AAIKALEVRTRELRAAQARTAELESRVAALERLLAGGEEASVLLTRVRQLETRLDALLKQQHDDEAGEIPRVRTAQPDVVPANLPGVTEVRQ